MVSDLAAWLSDIADETMNTGFFPFPVMPDRMAEVSAEAWPDWSEHRGPPTEVRFRVVAKDGETAECVRQVAGTVIERNYAPPRRRRWWR